MGVAAVTGFAPPALPQPGRSGFNPVSVMGNPALGAMHPAGSAMSNPTLNLDELKRGLSILDCVLRG